MLITIILIMTVLWLAWSNGGNDNFMGVATLYGSGTMSYRTALMWATITTGAGALVSIAMAGALVAAFNGRGIVPEAIEGSPALLISVATAAAGTKFLATLLGMPTSTTHALTGGLIGVGLLAGSGAAAMTTLGALFLIPLALSPLLAIGIVGVTYPILHRTRTALGVSSESCVCIGQPQTRELPAATEPVDVLTFRRFDVSELPRLRTSTIDACTDRYTGAICGVRAQSVVNLIHIISGGAVCFARAVNDTPKIAALLFVAGSSIVNWQLGLIAAAMVLGGLAHSRGIARTMSERITEMNTGQGTTANLVTSSLVMIASIFVLPVSTTHVSCSAIFGIGMLRGSPRWGTIRSIVLTWIVTLPMGIALGATCYWIITSNGGFSL